MKGLRICVLLLLGAAGSWAAAARTEFNAGRESYAAGEFKRAIRHFENAVAVSPSDAGYCFWLGRSYEALADIRTPLNRRPVSKAGAYLQKAAALAPGSVEYRDEFFNFLIEVDRSRKAFRRAKRMLLETSESDPSYSFMAWRLEHERSALASPEEWFGGLFQFVPRRLADVVQLATPARRIPRTAIAQGAQDASAPTER